MHRCCRFGLFIELVEHFVEGLVHVSTMADDYYRFVETAHMLRGENTQKVYRLGDKVRVQVVRVNMEVRQIDLGLVEILERVREGERGPRRSKARPKRDGGKRKGRPGKRERTGGARRQSLASMKSVVAGPLGTSITEERAREGAHRHRPDR
jgi:ribonuclease R